MLKAYIYITLKETVADPQGLTVKHALESLGYKSVEEVRMGKFITIRLKAQNKHEAEAKINAMCKQLLTNPIIEDYRFEVNEE